MASKMKQNRPNINDLFDSIGTLKIGQVSPTESEGKKLLSNERIKVALKINLPETECESEPN